jgi:hypothetical protein
MTSRLLELLGMVFMLIGAMGIGYHAGYRTAKTQGDLALSQYQHTQQAALAQAQQQASQAFTGQLDQNYSAEQRFLNATHALSFDQQQEHLDARFSTIKSIRLSRPSRNAVYRCVFSRRFVRLWNAASGVHTGIHSMQASGTTAITAATSRTTDALDSGVSQADLLAWFIDYAHRARKIEAQLNAVLDTQASEKSHG